MAYVQLGHHGDDQMEGIFSAIGGAFKKAGGFVAKKVVPAALPFVPVVGPVAAGAYSSIPGIRPRQAPTTSYSAPSPWMGTPGIAPTAPRESIFQRAARGAREAVETDPRFRRTVVDYTARYAPPELLAAASARQLGQAPPVVKAGLTMATVLPLVAIGAILLRRS